MEIFWEMGSVGRCQIETGEPYSGLFAMGLRNLVVLSYCFLLVEDIIEGDLSSVRERTSVAIARRRFSSLE